MDRSASELICALLLIESGYVVSSPIVQVARYDLIAEKDGEMFRIQVKSTMYNYTDYNFKKYQAKVKRKVKYKLNDFDFYAIHIIELNRWYFIPIAVAVKANNINLTIGKSQGKYERYLIDKLVHLSYDNRPGDSKNKSD